ncbi:DegT/DnrJ/EryC1/StrS family aminotransferase [Patescibacteria group bacterium]|nr:DegT/DnrJ/EryC1/StrS family aminotransferase [Patescibacteria group bacterium]MBU1931401.1 DegT/DnrJ/EryC1/StrS family aminotransferase [Patescibacteria group bacterium]
MKIPLIDLKREYQEIKPAINLVVGRVLKGGRFILGSEVKAFELQLARFCDCKYCVGVNSGTDGLILSLKALGIGPGDEVITVANTFSATVASIVHVGARPVLVDINPETYLIDLQKIEPAITKKTRAIIVVHLYGQPVEMGPVLKLARQYSLKVIIDAAQAIGSTYQGQPAGSFGDVSVFSFYPAKNLGAYGDAGAVVTNNRAVARVVRMLRHQGQSRKYHHELVGFNSRLDELQAAILRVKLKKLKTWNKQRRQWAKYYLQQLTGLSLVLPVQPAETQTNWYLFVVRVKKRDQLKRYLAKQGIECGIHYPVPIHLLPAFKNLGYEPGDFPQTEQITEQILSLPMFPQLTKKEIDYICQAIKRFDP